MHEQPPVSDAPIETPSIDVTRVHAAPLHLLRRQPLTKQTILRAGSGILAGVALWSVLFSLQVLPGSMDDLPGILTFIAVGAIGGTTRLRGALHAALGVAALVVCIVTVTPISHGLAAWWVRSDRMPDGGVSAAVVLSGTLNPDTTVSSESVDHLLTGIELVARGKSPLLVTTTTTEPFPTGVVVSDVDQARLIALFNDRIRWLRVPGGRSTHDEATASAAALLPNGIRRIAVIASPMHTRRACAAFEAVGFVVTCQAARLRVSGAIPLSPTPADRLAVFGQWVYEAAAVVKYTAHGWLRRGATESALTATR